MKPKESVEGSPEALDQQARACCLKDPARALKLWGEAERIKTLRKLNLTPEKIEALRREGIPESVIQESERIKNEREARKQAIPATIVLPTP